MDQSSSQSNGARTDGPGAIAVRAIAGAINHLLGQHPDARERLLAHQGARIRIGPDSDGDLGLPHLWFCVSADGLLEPAQPGEADVQLLVKPSLSAAMDLFTNGASGLTPHLRVEGSVMLAGLIGDLAQNLRWDYEDDLANVLGDIPARRVGQAVNAGREFLDSIAQQATGQVSRAAASDNSPLTDRSGFDRLRDSIDELSKRVDKLEANTRLRSKD